jgi:hypothetical protein
VKNKANRPGLGVQRSGAGHLMPDICLLRAFVRNEPNLGDGHGGGPDYRGDSLIALTFPVRYTRGVYRSLSQRKGWVTWLRFVMPCG